MQLGLTRLDLSSQGSKARILSFKHVLKMAERPIIPTCKIGHTTNKILLLTILSECLGGKLVTVELGYRVKVL